MWCVISRQQSSYLKPVAIRSIKNTFKVKQDENVSEREGHTTRKKKMKDKEKNGRRCNKISWNNCDLKFNCLFQVLKMPPIF